MTSGPTRSWPSERCTSSPAAGGCEGRDPRRPRPLRGEGDRPDDRSGPVTARGLGSRHLRPSRASRARGSPGRAGPAASRVRRRAAPGCYFSIIASISARSFLSCRGLIPRSAMTTSSGSGWKGGSFLRFDGGVSRPCSTRPAVLAHAISLAPRPTAFAAVAPAARSWRRARPSLRLKVTACRSVSATSVSRVGVGGTQLRVRYAGLRRPASIVANRWGHEAQSAATPPATRNQRPTSTSGCTPAGASADSAAANPSITPALESCAWKRCSMYDERVTSLLGDQLHVGRLGHPQEHALSHPLLTVRYVTSRGRAPERLSP